ncbi:Crp/Fnr family transcriptional regulator [Hymenobacter terrenus]|uniref:Crp/Fnr family transcriptional regulator n=1 Tax=Hymenobacter terrenus TaxID=1629124 RepID=UPI000AE9C234|nr:Crp/Fnr family transcriptional regulator [Hymenobacter terrenus]
MLPPASLALFLRQMAPFTPEQLALIVGAAAECAYRPGEYFAQAGRVAQEIGFVVSGVFRVCYFDREGRDVTKYFLDEAHFMVDLQSQQYQLPSTEYIQAVTAAQVLVFSARAWENLRATMVGWEAIERTLISRALLEKVGRRSPLVHDDAATRYRHFLRQFPTLANRIPLAHLASYLGITPQSLSRIRRTSIE